MRTIFAISIVAALALAGCANTPAPSSTSTSSTSTTTTSTPAGTPDPDAKWDLAFVAKQSAPPGPNTTNVTYSFDGPAKAAAGWVTIHLQNQGFEAHQAVVMRLNGTPFEAFMAQMMGTAMTNATNDTNQTMHM